MEKINIKELDEYTSGKKKESKRLKISFENRSSNDKNIQFRIKEIVDNNTRLLSVSKKDNTYVRICETIYYKNSHLIKNYSSNGNLKSKVVVGIKEEIKDDVLGTIVYLNSNVGSSEYYNSKGEKIIEFNYETLYKFNKRNLISYLRKNYRDENNIAIDIDKRVFSDFTITNVDSLIKESNINNIKIKKNHPYWIVSINTTNLKGQFLKTIYIDGISGDKVGENSIGPITSF